MILNIHKPFSFVIIMYIFNHMVSFLLKIIPNGIQVSFIYIYIYTHNSQTILLAKRKQKTILSSVYGQQYTLF